MELKPYMGYSREGGSAEGAVLVFAHSIKEAKPIAYHAMQDWFDTDYIDVAVNWMKNSNFLYKDADPKKLKAGIAHAVDEITSCKDCDQWGQEINEQGICVNCQAEIDENKRFEAELKQEGKLNVQRNTKT